MPTAIMTPFLAFSGLVSETPVFASVMAVAVAAILLAGFFKAR